MMLSTAIESFLDIKASEVGNLCLRDYRCRLRNLLNEIGDQELHEITDLKILNYLNKKQLSFLGFNNYRKNLNAFFQFWHKRRAISENPVYFVEPKKPNRVLGEMRPHEVPKDLPVEIRREILSRFKLYSNPKYHSFACFLAATGARPAESRKLLKSHLGPTEAYLSQTKTYIPRTLFFPEAVGRIIIDYSKSHDSKYVWPSRDDLDTPMSYSGFKKEWDQLRYGLVQPITKILITPYMFRHSFTTDMLGLVDALEGSKYMGNSPESFKGYIHANKQRLKLTYDKVRHLNVFAPAG
jgi:integrase